MPVRQRYAPRPQADQGAVPFVSAEEAWFWFIQAQTARLDGAKAMARAGGIERPCEPVDIFRVMERLYRARKLMMDHILVLRFYGRRLLPPDATLAKEFKASRLWSEALDAMEEVLVAKGIVTERPWYLPFEA